MKLTIKADDGNKSRSLWFCLLCFFAARLVSVVNLILRLYSWLKTKG